MCLPFFLEKLSFGMYEVKDRFLGFHLWLIWVCFFPFFFLIIALSITWRSGPKGFYHNNYQGITVWLLTFLIVLGGFGATASVVFPSGSHMLRCQRSSHHDESQGKRMRLCHSLTGKSQGYMYIIDDQFGGSGKTSSNHHSLTCQSDGSVVFGSLRRRGLGLEQCESIWLMRSLLS